MGSSGVDLEEEALAFALALALPLLPLPPAVGREVTDKKQKRTDL